LLADMMKANTVLHTIDLSLHESDHEIYTESILPYLETNRYRPRVFAIQKADFQIRRALLGRALQTELVQNDSNLRWMLLSGNPDIVVQSTEDDEQVVEGEASAHVEGDASVHVEVETSAHVEGETSAGEACRKRKH
jgi:hypothetical protein